MMAKTRHSGLLQIRLTQFQFDGGVAVRIDHADVAVELLENVEVVCIIEQPTGDAPTPPADLTEPLCLRKELADGQRNQRFAQR